MPTRPDLRQIATNVKDALGDCDRETLLDLLTFVLKEYVVDGPPPMLMHQAETIAELGGLSFAQLVTALQTRLDLPELALFAVDGERVSVRVGGVMQPLDASRVAPPAAELPRPAAGVHVVETTLTQRPPTPTQPAQVAAAREQQGTAPRPTGGLSLRGTPTAGGGQPAAPAPAAQPPAAPVPAPAAAQQPPAQPASGQPEKKDSPDGDDASARFSLLELD
jgi:hypothetical protein